MSQAILPLPNQHILILPGGKHMALCKESFFPATYRAAQVQEIMDAIARLRSIAVFGLAGMGKSNVFRFIASHPHVKPRYLGASAARFTLVLIDCNLVDPHDEQSLLQELDTQLQRAGMRLPADAPHDLSPRFSIRLRLESVEPERAVVLLMDPLDLAFQSLAPHFWAYLRGLRDVKGNVAFVLGARRPPPPLRELQELLTDACWITPLNRRDAFDSLARDEKRLEIHFSKQTKTQLFELSGGHPGLLKNAAELVGRGKVELGAPTDAVVRQFLASETICQVCSDLWSDVKPEWKTSEWIGLNVPEAQLDQASLAFLRRAGILQPRSAALAFFSPLMQEYIRAQSQRVVRIRLGTFGETQIESWQGALALRVGESSFRLLRLMAQQPDKIYTRAQLSHVLYAGEANYSGEALAAHIKRLRKTLNVALGQVIAGERFDALVSERKQGYRLNLKSNNGWTLEYHVTS